VQRPFLEREASFGRGGEYIHAGSIASTCAAQTPSGRCSAIVAMRNERSEVGVVLDRYIGNVT
jgi:hypothetical protein